MENQGIYQIKAIVKICFRDKDNVNRWLLVVVLRETESTAFYIGTIWGCRDGSVGKSLTLKILDYVFVS